MAEKQKILIVDDRKENLVALRKVLCEVDAELIEAGNGNDALAATLDHNFALALLDVQMPGMNGYELAELLRLDKKTQMIPIVFLTANTGEERLVFKGYEAGAVDYIVKPYPPELLRGKVKALLEIAHYRSELETYRDHLENLVSERTKGLNKRVKEIKCLYTISSLVAESRGSAEELLEAAVNLIPSGWQYPEITCAKIVLNSREFYSANFRDTAWKQSADIMLSGKTAGTVEVCYLEERPTFDEGPFLREEKNLIDDLARQLGFMLERRMAEEALRHEQTLVLTLMDNLPDSIYFKDTDSRFLRVNLALAKLFGASASAQLIGKSDADFFSANHAQKALSDEQAIMRTGQPILDIEEKETWPDGHKSWVLTSKLPLRDHAGKIIGTCGISKDITERKEAEQRQALSYEIHDILNSPLSLPEILGGVLSAIKRETDFDAVGIRLKSGDDFPYFVQNGFSKNFLLSENNLVSRDSDGGICRDKDGIIRLECTCGLIISGKTDPKNPLFTPGGSFWTNNSFSLLNLTSDQDPRLNPRNRCIHEGYGSMALIPIRANHKIVGLLQINNRKTDSLTPDMIRFYEGISANIGIALMHKQDEEALALESSKLVAAFENTDMGLVLSDGQGGNISMNAAALRFHGFASVEDMHRKVHEYADEWELRYPDGRIIPYDEWPLVRATRGDFVRDCELHYHNIRSGYKWICNFTSVPVRNSAGEVTLIVQTLLDVTRHKRAEEEKEKLEMRLRVSQKMEAVGQLAGGISHDFNNLLSVINGYAQMILLDSNLDAMKRQNIEEMLRAGERASALTRQLLVFSRHQCIEPKIIDLDEIISGMEKMLRRLIRENITIARRKGSAVGPIKADPGSIEQVIMNLVVNAGDAMPDGGTLTVETESVEVDETNRIAHPADIKSGRYTVIAVSDTGCGMDDKVRERIFEPFFTTKEVGKGTGLGLATVYGIVKQSDAYIDVQSELGKGTRFRIYFPQVVSEGAAIEKQEKTTIMPQGDETILLTEDENNIREMLQNFLHFLGYTVLPTCNGKEALGLAENHKGEIHLLLTDLVMPEMNGFELAEKVKNLVPEIKLLFMSGYSKPTDTQTMMSIKNNFIQKPLSLDILSVKLRELLDK